MFVKMLSERSATASSHKRNLETKLRIQKQHMLGKKIVKGLVYVALKNF